MNHGILNSNTGSSLPTVIKEGNLVLLENMDNGVNSKGSAMAVLDADLHYPLPSSNIRDPTIKEIKFSMGCTIGNVDALGVGRKKGKPKLATTTLKRPKNVRSKTTIKPMNPNNENIVGMRGPETKSKDMFR